MRPSRNTALVTGGAGFIGSHLVDRLVADGHDVVVIDDLSSGNTRNLNKSARVENVDIQSPELADLVQSANPALVFHLAAQISVSVSAREPKFDAGVNLLGTLNLLDAMSALATPPRIVFTSTGGAIYGEPEDLPAAESLIPRPLSPYGASKLAAEGYLPVYERLHGISYAILRLANVYGPRQDPHGEAGVVAIFSRAMLAGKPVTIFGDGTDERDYVYVGDVVDAYVAAIGNPESRGPYNIGTGVGTNVNELAALLSHHAGYDQKPRYAPPRPGDVRRISLDATHASRELGWRPRVSLAEGLERTVAWFRDNP